MQKIAAGGLKNIPIHKPVTQSRYDSAGRSCKVSEVGTRAMIHVSAQKKTEVIRNGVRLIIPKRGRIERGSRIQVTPIIPVSVNKGVAPLASEFTAEDMDIFSTPDIIEVVNEAHALGIIDQGMDGVERVMVLETIMDVPAQARAQAVRNAVSLIAEGMNPREITYIIDAVAGMPTPVNQEDVVLAASIIDPRMGCFARMKILGAVMDVPAQKRAQIVRNAAPMIAEGMSSFDRSYIIRAINNMRVPVSEADVVLASNAFDQGMDAAERVEILRAVMDVPAQKELKWLRALVF